MTISRQSAHDLFISLLRTHKLMLVAREHLPPALAPVDPATQPVLFTLTRGPARVSDLAAAVHADLSTVSRQVSALAALGLVSKQGDPADGRAHVITLTTEGEAVSQAITDQRATWLRDRLGAWDPGDVEHLERLLGRLGDELDGWLGSLGATLPPPPASTAPSS